MRRSIRQEGTRRARRSDRTAPPLLAVSVVLVAASMSARAWAAPRDEKEACVAASDQAQTLRDDGKFRRAREALLSCARPSCPGIVRNDCEKWLAELDASYPTVVFGARDAKGRDVSGVHVFIDNTPLSDKLDGKPVPIEPGEHIFRYEAAGAVTSQERVVIRVGEKNRAITAQLRPVVDAASPVAPEGVQAPSGTEALAAPEVPVTRGSRSPAVALVLGGVGIAAIASFAYFGVTGKSDIDELRSSCAPHCAQSDVDAAKTKLLIADISLGVGVVALVSSAWVFIAHSGSPSTSAKNANTDALRVGSFRVLPGGGFATFDATF